MKALLAVPLFLTTSAFAAPLVPATMGSGPWLVILCWKN
jgi:hypothetical protein